MFNQPDDFWGKASPHGAGSPGIPVAEWHPLLSHCADVESAFRALLSLTSYRSRAEHLLRAELSPAHIARLALFAFLHDIGKANAAFQFKIMPRGMRAPWHRDLACGHLREATCLLFHPDLWKITRREIPLTAMSGWFADSDDIIRMLWASWSHHGVPLAVAANGAGNVDERAWKYWEGGRWAKPSNALEMFGQAIRTWFDDAFTDAAPLVMSPEFQGFYCGLLSLADWVGSNADIDWFPFGMPGDPPRTPWARDRAVKIVQSMGLDGIKARAAAARRPDFPTLFGLPHGSLPNDMQRSIMGLTGDPTQ